jgi:mRNA-degrading endonuclease RelE of RelBE toxin-antitoxin system
MPGYQLLLTPRAKKDLKKIDRSQIKRIDATILKLEKTPYLPVICPA